VRASTRAGGPARLGLRAVSQDAEAVVSELVANAVTHGSPDKPSGGVGVVYLCLMAGWSSRSGMSGAGAPTARPAGPPASAVVEVWDASPLPPVLRQDVPADAENGRGMLMVDALCQSWRCDAISGWPGKRVRAVLNAE
jgi:two-component sensor histidine kinase